VILVFCASIHLLILNQVLTCIIERMLSFGYLYVWYTYRVWTLDKFDCLHPKRFKQGELKSIVTLLILFMIPFQLFYGMGPLICTLFFI
jgi:hypothetical protein